MGLDRKMERDLIEAFHKEQDMKTKDLAKVANAAVKKLTPSKDAPKNVQGMSALEKSWQPGQAIVGASNPKGVWPDYGPKTDKPKIVKPDKVTESRLEMMRQITKPNSAVVETVTTVWLLIDDESQATLGVYSTEDRAWAMSQELYDRYEVEAWVEAMDIDTDLLNINDRYDDRY